MKVKTQHPSSGFRLDGVVIEMTVFEAAKLADFLTHNLDRMQPASRTFREEKQPDVTLSIAAKGG